MGKFSFLVGFGAGYVLGAKAGEKRYEQIKSGANQALHHPVVQEQLNKATETAKERGPEVAAAAGKAAMSGITHTAKSAATAGFHAATGKSNGPVVESRVADTDADRKAAGGRTEVGFAMDRHGVDPNEDAEADSGNTKLDNP